jgi:hypothetical protein
MNTKIAPRVCAAIFCALGWGHGCSIDGRELSGEDLVSGSECPSVGANACQTCLFEDCCSESLACREGSDCLDYLGCVERCSGDVACATNCRQEYPRGLAAAGNLEGCGRSECATECAQAGAAPSACNTQGSGTCENPADCAALASEGWAELGEDACPACGMLDGAGCAACLSEQTGLSFGCASCVSDWLFCAAFGCYQQCGEGADEAECSRCLASAEQCNSRFASCGFSG